MQNQNIGLRAWQKWALLSVLILGLSSIVIYFNFAVFGIADGWPYVAVVGFIVLLSFIVTTHIKRNPNAVTQRFLQAAFIFEVMLALALMVSVVYCLSVQREMSVAGQAETSQRETIKEIGKLKGGKTQREALRIAGGTVMTKTRQQIFTENERPLFWIMIGELGIALLATFTLLGLSVFDTDKNGIPDFMESKSEFPQEEIPMEKL